MESPLYTPANVAAKWMSLTRCVHATCTIYSYCTVTVYVVTVVVVA